jgi:hypothetical protein
MQRNIWLNMGVNTGDEDSIMLKTDTLQVTLELLALIAEVDEFKGAWRARLAHCLPANGKVRCW